MTVSAADIPAYNPNSNKILSATGVSILSINGKLAVINGPKEFKNLPSWLVTFLAAPFNKIPLFSKDLITFIISFTSSFVRVIPEPVIFSLLTYLFAYLENFFLDISVLFLATVGKIFPKIGISRRTPPNCKILDN